MHSSQGNNMLIRQQADHHNSSVCARTSNPSGRRTMQWCLPSDWVGVQAFEEMIDRGVECIFCNLTTRVLGDTEATQSTHLPTNVLVHWYLLVLLVHSYLRTHEAFVAAMRRSPQCWSQHCRLIASRIESDSRHVCMYTRRRQGW